MPQPASSPREIWSAVLGSLQLEVARHNFDTWLKDTVGLSAEGEDFIVGVPSGFVAECLEKRMAPLVRQALKRQTGGEWTLRYEIVGQGRVTPQRSQALAGPSEPRRDRPFRGTGTALNSRYTFDTFVVGKANRFAHAAAIAVSENPGSAYNPLFIHAGVGLGKTHLLHAIGHAVAARGQHFLHASAEHFTNDFVTALRENRVEAFRDKYRQTEVLLIDDIQFIAGKEHSRESFFHTFNDLHTWGKQIVITSDSRPKSIPLLEDRLSSRFEGGLMADISPPDLETRMAIVGAKADQAGVHLKPDVAEMLARKFLRNVRELEGGLNKLLAMSQMGHRSIDMALAEQAMVDMHTDTVRVRNYHPADIIDVVAAYYGLTTELLIAETRKKNVAHARQVAAYLLRQETARSLADIGRLLGDRGHSTILRAHAKIAADVDVTSDLRRQIGEIRDALDRRASRSVS